MCGKTVSSYLLWTQNYQYYGGVKITPPSNKNTNEVILTCVFLVDAKKVHVGIVAYLLYTTTNNMSKTRLPQGYERPVVPPKYARIEVGENRYRVLSEPITWRVYFNHEEKPIRVRTSQEVNLKDVGEWRFWKQNPVHFRTFIVWDYQHECVNILEISKKKVLDAFQKVLRDKDYADPTEYDIVITKEGLGRETTYLFRTGKHAPIPQDAIDKLSDCNINLERLFDYLGDPYES